MVEKIAAGNWKMNGTGAALEQLAAIAEAADANTCTTVICPPSPLLSRAHDAVDGTSLALGGQDCHAAASGAHTGDTAADMLLDAGAAFVILGHSERRADHGETSAGVAAKTVAALETGLRPIVCVGETLTEREAGQTLHVVTDQLQHSIPADPGTGLVVAYEPVWAIGTGKTATPDIIAEVHAAIRAHLTERFGKTGATMPILYGGSVKAANAAEIFAVDDVNGALVGGASLKAEDFIPIMRALSAA